MSTIPWAVSASAWEEIVICVSLLLICVAVDVWEPGIEGTKGWQGHHALAPVSRVVLLSRINLFPAQSEEKHRNETFKQKNDPSILSLPSLASLPFLCFSLVLVLALADTAGWKEINLHPLKYVFSEWNLWLENQLDLKNPKHTYPGGFHSCLIYFSNVY